jgi:biotin carboxyl carrier protein
MKLRLTINGARKEIEILTPAPDCHFRFGGTECAAEVELAQPGIYSVLVDGRSYDARVDRTETATVVTIEGYRFEVQVEDPRRWSRKSGHTGAAGVETLTAPMPGKVVRVLAGAGDTVSPGQGIVVVEAMKMQNELKTSRAGRVLAIHAHEGATVAAGDALVTIE